MATDRSPIAYIWPTLKALATGDVITRELLRDSINKAGDIGYGVLAALNERFQQLGSTNAGTSAVQRGTVVMGTLSFYDPVDVPVGDLDGRTLILETDLAGPVTVTFSQPTSPVHVVSQINTQAAALGLVASVDSGVDPNTGAVVAANVGKLLLVRPSGASADMIVKGAGTANALLGLPLIDTTVTGTGTANDGSGRIGVAAFGAWAGGTLRAFLQTVITTNGGTLVAPLIVGSGGSVEYRAVVDLPDADATLSLDADFYRLTGNHAAARTYTLPNPPRAGMIRTVFKTDSFAGVTNDSVVQRVDATIIGEFDTSISARGFVTFVSVDIGGTLKWIGMSAGGGAVGYDAP